MQDEKLAVKQNTTKRRKKEKKILCKKEKENCKQLNKDIIYLDNSNSNNSYNNVYKKKLEG